jgi:hypothetical protein
VTGLEERLREAYREAGETVRPQTIRDLGERAGRPARNPRSARRGRRTTRVLAPLAAAVCVAAVAVIASSVIPHLTGEPRHRAHHPATARHARRSVPSALAALPEFTILNNGSNLTVVATATGHVMGRVAAPSGQTFDEVAGTAGDRVFYAATELRSQGSCHTVFYRIGLSTTGEPLAPAPLTVPQMRGLPTALAASADGGLLAYSVVGCAGNTSGYIPAGQAVGHIGIIDVSSGSVTRQWSYTLSEDYPNDVSLSATGSLLGYSVYREAASYSAPSFQVGRVLATRARPGPDYLRSRVIIRTPAGAQAGIASTALSTSGALMYAITSGARQTLAAYDTSDGRRVQVLHSWPSETRLGQLSADLAGGYLLLAMGHQIPPAPRPAKGCLWRIINGVKECQFVPSYNTVFVSVDLATGNMTTLPFTMPGPPGSDQAAW